MNGETHIRLGELRDQLFLVRECLLRLARADHPVEQPREVLLEPLHAPLELALLSRGDEDEPEAHVRERDEPVVRTLDRRRAVEVVGLPELFYLAHGLVGVAPVGVLWDGERPESFAVARTTLTIQ